MINNTRIDSTSTRFWSKVREHSDSQCWEWQGALSGKGYGNFYVSTGRWSLAHRFAFEELRGPIPEGLVLDHLCRNLKCVNPDHLEPVTQKVNILRGDSPMAQQRRRTHCPAGHALSGDNLLTWTRRNGSVSRKCRECDRARHRVDREVPV